VPLVPDQPGHPAPRGPRHDRTVAQGLRGAFRELGDLPGDGAVFVRVNAAFLAGDLPVPTHPGRVVAEVDGLAECHDGVRDGLLRLKALGCRIALGDFTGRPDQRRLLPFADFVKIDSWDLDLEGRPLLDLGRSRGAELVAEFVDSRDALDQCRAAGVTLVQGRVFEPGAPQARPSVLSSAAGC
jgi:EAL and modified HD-GYP domain-containing signal transduction protein